MEKYSFEELKMIYESAEKVTDRRLSTNTTNHSICIGVVVAIAVIWKWASDNPNYFFSGLLLVMILSAIAAIYSSLWIGQIRDFKNLNAAKFDVINEMAKHIHFQSAQGDSISLGLAWTDCRQDGH